jgi:hypothetical protein
MATFRIEGLTQRQVEICDKLWSLDTHEEVMEWFASLPPNEFMEAVTLQTMMLESMFEEDMERDDPNHQQAKSMLESIGIKC